jgi:hypothetical protein
MKRAGVFIAILGAGSFLLNMAGREFVLLMWIDMFGTTIGTVIRVALIVLGIGLFLVGLKAESDSAGSGGSPST